jgi:phage terminase large subunit-like protein
VRFEELAQQFESDDKIPSAELYNYLQSVRDDLVENWKSDPNVIPGTRLGKEVRRRCQRDLFFLAKYFLWETNPAAAGQSIEENRISEEPYQVICDFFVRKDPDKKIAEQDAFRNRLLLWPRGGFKSTIDICDTVQWILCFPAIRVFYITAAEDLAIGFVSETKAHFYIKPDNPTLCNIFWPEFCVLEKDAGNQFEFRCPVYESKYPGRKDPTVYATSVGSTQSGWHCEVMKGDDPVSNKNSETVDQCIKVRNGLKVSRKMLVQAAGYDDKIGTRYDDEDAYGEMIAKNVGDLKTTVGNCWTLTENLSSGTKVLIGHAIEIKPEVEERLRKEGKPVTYKEATEAGCNLLIPHVLSYSRLMYEYALDEVSFEGQFNQNPRPPSSTPFTRAMLVSNTVDFKDMPLRGPISHTWDLAFSTKKKRDHTTGSAAIWNEKGQCFIKNLVRDRFNPTALAKAVVDMARQDHPFIIGIEDAGGSRLLEPTIQAEALKTGDPDVIAVCNRIDWVPIENQKDAKKARMSTMHPWFLSDRLKLAKHLPFLEIAYNEIERCLLNTPHDDIPDTISRQLKYAPAIQREITKKGGIESYKQADLSWNMLYEDGGDITTSQGYLLVMNPETGELEWNAQPIANPISVPVQMPDRGPQAEVPHAGLDCILGTGIWG